MSGVENVGGALDGWSHVQQSIVTILTTPLNSRVMRRDFGSELPDLIDAPMNQRVIMAVFVAVAIALEPRLMAGDWYGEPRFKLASVEILNLSSGGQIEMRLHGDYFPNGHQGDRSVGASVMTSGISILA